MALRIHGGSTPLDLEVAAMLRRFATMEPLNHIVNYTVRRSPSDVHRVTIEFIADAEFDASAEQAQGQAEESPEPPPSLGAHLAGLAGDSVFTKPDPQQD